MPRRKSIKYSALPSDVQERILSILQLFIPRYSSSLGNPSPLLVDEEDEKFPMLQKTSISEIEKKYVNTLSSLFFKHSSLFNKYSSFEVVLNSCIEDLLSPPPDFKSENDIFENKIPLNFTLDHSFVDLPIGMFIKYRLFYFLIRSMIEFSELNINHVKSKPNYTDINLIKATNLNSNVLTNQFARFVYCIAKVDPLFTKTDTFVNQFGSLSSVLKNSNTDLINEVKEINNSLMDPTLFNISYGLVETDYSYQLKMILIVFVYCEPVFLDLSDTELINLINHTIYNAEFFQSKNNSRLINAIRGIYKNKSD